MKSVCLKSNEPDYPVHLSHFHSLVSAYETCKETVDRLAHELTLAQSKAKTSLESVIVSQDSNDFFFVVHPSGSVDLCARLRSFSVEVQP